MSRYGMLLVTSMGLGLSALAQDEYAIPPPPPPPRPFLQDLVVLFGSVIQDEPYYTVEQWRNLLPTSSILKEDIPPTTAFNWYTTGTYYADPGLFVGLSFAPDRSPRQGARFDGQVRVGLALMPLSYFSESWGRSVEATFDTLVSQSTGQIFLIDTTWFESWYADYEFTRLCLDATYILRRRTPSRWSWSMGAGAGAGLTLGNRGYVSYNTGVRSDRYYYNMAPRIDTVREMRSESIRASSGFSGTLHALVGVEFRLSKLHPFWSRLNLRYEFQPMMQFIDLPGVPWRSAAAYRSMFGLRLELY